MTVAALTISVPLTLGADLCMEKKGCILHGEGDLAPAGWSRAPPSSGFLDKETSLL